MAEADAPKNKLKTKFDLSAEKPVFSWQSPEFVRYQRKKRWYLGVIAVALILATILGYMGQWSGVAVVVVAATLFVTLSGANPKDIKCALYNDGVVVDGKVYSFAQFKSFWLSGGEMVKAKLQMTGRFAGQIVLPMVDIDFEQVRLFLSKHLPEEENKGEDITDTINHLLRF